MDTCTHRRHAACAMDVVSRDEDAKESFQSQTPVECIISAGIPLKMERLNESRVTAIA